MVIKIEDTIRNDVMDPRLNAVLDPFCIANCIGPLHDKPVPSTGMKQDETFKMLSASISVRYKSFQYEMTKSYGPSIVKIKVP